MADETRAAPKLRVVPGNRPAPLPMDHPKVAAFVEERYLRDVLCAVPRMLLSAKASIPHVGVAQGFQAFVADRGDPRAKEDADLVFRLLNDDGVGKKRPENTAVGYRFLAAADVFREMTTLPIDAIDVPTDAPVPNASRFNEAFVLGNLGLEEVPKPYLSRPLTLIRLLLHVRIVARAILNFLDGPLHWNAEVVYSAATKERYLRRSVRIRELLTDAIARCGRAARILDRYLDVPLPDVERMMAEGQDREAAAAMDGVAARADHAGSGALAFASGFCTWGGIVWVMGWSERAPLPLLLTGFGVGALTALVAHFLFCEDSVQP